MGLELKQSLKLSQQLVMTPQLQQAIRLLQLSRMELEQEIAVEMEQNPALEVAAETAEEQLAEKAPGEASLEAENIEAPAQSEAQNNTSADVTEVTSETKTADIDWEQYLESYQTLGHTAPVARDSGSEDMPGYEATLTKKESLSDHLLEQLSMLELTEEEQRVGQEIIGNIDEHGYFRMEGTEGDPLIAVASACGVSIECGEKVLRLIQGFEPQGVASRDLQECLLLQAKALKQDAHLVATIIKFHMKHLETNNIPAIARELKCSTERGGARGEGDLRDGAAAGPQLRHRGAAVHHPGHLRSQDGRQVRARAQRRRPLEAARLAHLLQRAQERPAERPGRQEVHREEARERALAGPQHPPAATYNL